MTADIICPVCGEAEELRGEREAEGLSIGCERCGNRWTRDSAAACATCGGGELLTRPRAMTQYSRGTQLSVVGWQDIALCVTCDAEMLQRSTYASGPVPSDYRPAAQHPPDA